MGSEPGRSDGGGARRHERRLRIGATALAALRFAKPMADKDGHRPAARRRRGPVRRRLGPGRLVSRTGHRKSGNALARRDRFRHRHGRSAWWRTISGRPVPQRRQSAHSRARHWPTAEIQTISTSRSLFLADREHIHFRECLRIGCSRKHSNHRDWSARQRLELMLKFIQKLCLQARSRETKVHSHSGRPRFPGS